VLAGFALVHLHEHRIVDLGAERALDRFKIYLVAVRRELYAGRKPVG